MINFFAICAKNINFADITKKDASKSLKIFCEIAKLTIAAQNLNRFIGLQITEYLKTTVINMLWLPLNKQFKIYAMLNVF